MKQFTPYFYQIHVCTKLPLRLSAMQWVQTLACYCLLLGMLLSVTAAYALPVQTDISHQPEFKSCQKQIVASNDYYLVSVVQYQLLTLYQDNPEFRQAISDTPKLFTDGHIGPTTRYWLSYFCSDFSLSADKEKQTPKLFAESIQSNLNRASQLNVLFPTWRKKISPQQLLKLNVSKISDILTTDVKSDKNQTTRTQVYYQITKQDLKSASKLHKTLAAIRALKIQQFDQRTQLYNTLDSFFSQLLIDKAEQPSIDSLIQSHQLQIVQPSSNETQSNSTSVTQTVTEGSQKSDEKTSHKIETKTKSTLQSTVPQIVWQVNASALETLLNKITPKLSEELIEKLKPIQEEVFYNTDLLAMAMKLQGIEISRENFRNVCLLAKKEKFPPREKISPVMWQAPEDCGCQDSHTSIFNDGIFYGFYPYWKRSKKGQNINFSQLDRIGYVAAVIQPSAEGSQLVLPPNWHPDPQYSQFIQLSKRYRSNIDLVVTLHKPTAKQVDQLLDKQLIEQLVSSITQPLDGYFINRIKPLLSLGFAPVPTLGDGITLDIDLSKLTTPQSQQQFIGFVRELKLALLRHERKGHLEATTPFAKPSDKYYLNIIVPVKNVIKDKTNGFYQLDNLSALAKYSNLIIMRPSNPSRDDKENELKQIQDLQNWLTHQSDQEKVKQLFQKMLPMLVTEDNRTQEHDLNQLFHLSSWTFTGAAYWPIPLTPISSVLVEKVFFPPTNNLTPIDTLISKAVELLAWVCPNRWLLRLVLFIAFTGIISILLVSVRYYPLRSSLSKWPFVALCTLSLIGLLLVFIGDPYFKDYQGPITLIFMAVIGWISFAVRLARKVGDKP